MGEFGETAEPHAEIMAILWGPAANVAIFMALYSYRRYPFFIHALFGLFACIFTLSTSIPMLMTTGIVPADSTIDEDFPGSVLNSHYLVGITCLVVITLETLLGIVTRVVNIAGGKSSTILLIKKIHQIFGFMILILCKSNIYIIAPE
jgi:cytochrome b561